MAIRLLSIKQGNDLSDCGLRQLNICAIVNFWAEETRWHNGADITPVLRHCWYDVEPQKRLLAS